MSCKKCGHHAIIGPIYIEATKGYYGESLQYRCGRCSYSWDTPTLDKGKTLEQIGIEQAQAVGRKALEELTQGDKKTGEV